LLAPRIRTGLDDGNNNPARPGGMGGGGINSMLPLASQPPAMF